MSTQRLTYVLIVAVLLAVALVSLRQVTATQAAGPANLSQPARRHFAGSSVQADRSYDQIEIVRGSRGMPAAPSHGPSCPDDECTYQLPNGHRVR